MFRLLAESLRRVLLAIQKRKTAMAGALMLAVFCPALFLSLLWSWLGGLQNPYLDFFNYLVFAPLALLGLVLLVVGIMRQGGEDVGLYAYEYLREQLIMPGRFSRIRKFILLVAGLSVALLFVVAMTFYGSVRYTDTTAFCATFCHTVMEPHAATHANSSHSQVACISCHIAAGSGWATRTKLSGARQLAATLLGSYPRPIASPITELRPTERACRFCHRPEKHDGHKVRIIDRFLADEANTRLQTILLMKIGERDHLSPVAHGIHWHTSGNHSVWYTAAPNDRNDIRTVVVENKDGTRTTYVKSGQPAAPAPEAATRRLMDCMDCHNRTGHPFLGPEAAIDQKLLTGRIPAELPYIRQQALTAVTATYPDRVAGRIAISRAIHDWYAEHYPELARQKGDRITAAIAGIVEALEENVFPAMTVTWTTYDTMLGHAGCFRCHNDRLHDAHGRTIPTACDICHAVLAEKVSPARARDWFGLTAPRQPRGRGSSVP